MAVVLPIPLRPTMETTDDEATLQRKPLQYVAFPIIGMYIVHYEKIAHETVPRYISLILGFVLISSGLPSATIAP